MAFQSELFKEHDLKCFQSSTQNATDVILAYIISHSTRVFFTLEATELFNDNLYSVFELLKEII